MFIGLTLPVFILGSLALALADYLWRLIKPPVPDTTPLSQPYNPLFLGGQCENARYQVIFRIAQLDGQVGYSVASSSGSDFGNFYPNIQSIPVGNVGQVLIGKLTTLTPFKYQNGQYVQGWAVSDKGLNYVIQVANSSYNAVVTVAGVRLESGAVDNCGDLPNPNPVLPIGGNGLPSTPPPVLYPPPNSPPNTPPSTPNNNWFPLIAGLAAVAGTALTAATAAAAATAATAVTAATAAATAATAASASAPSGSTTQQQAQSQKLSADALVGIAQVLAEIAKQIAELEKETRKLKTDEAKKEKDDAKKVIRYDFGSANRDGFIKLYPDSNPDSYEATFIDVQIFNIPSGSGRYFGEKSPHYYKYKSLGQIHFVSPTFGILESREIDFARLSLNVPDNCFGFFYHFGLDGIVSANLSCFYTKTEKQAV